MRSIGTAFLLFVGGLVIVGFLLGSSTSDSDWLSPITNAAQAQRIEAQTQLEFRRGNLELDYLEESLAQQLQDEKAARAQWRALRELGFIVGLGIGSAAILLMTGGLVYYLVCRGQLALAERARYQRTIRPQPTVVRPLFPVGKQQRHGRPSGPVGPGGGPKEAA